MTLEKWTDPHGRAGVKIALTRYEQLTLTLSVSGLDLTGATLSGSAVGADGAEVLDLAPSLSGSTVSVDVEADADQGRYLFDILAELAGGENRYLLRGLLVIQPQQTAPA